MRLQTRNVEDVGLVNTVLLSHFLPRLIFIEWPEFLRAAVVVNERVHTLWVCSIRLDNFIAAEVGDTDDRVHLVAEMRQNEIKHSARERKFSWRSDVSAGMGGNNYLSRRSKPEKRVHARLEPMNDVELFIQVFPEKRESPEKTCGYGQLELRHDDLPHFFVEGIVAWIEMHKRHIEIGVFDESLY